MVEPFVPQREEIEEVLDFDVAISKFENQAEQRRLRGTRKVMGFRIRCSAATRAAMTEYRNYFIARYGAYEAFPFTSPFDNTSYSVRFVPESWHNVFARGTFAVEFELKVVY